MDYNEITNRIDELNLDGYKQIKNNDWGLPANLIQWLQDKNFTKLGRGIASEVWSSNTENFVVKLNRGYIDKGYIDFVDFCESYKRNKHLPKLGKLKKYEDWYIIFIEKLEPYNPSFLQVNDTWDFFDRLLKNYQYVRPDNFTFEEIFTATWKKYSTNSDKELDESKINQIEEIVKLMFEFKNNYGYGSLDLHEGNIMMRGDTIVVIDPALD